jgi:hydrogenase nickel incorporation protein HypA/HybF
VHELTATQRILDAALAEGRARGGQFVRVVRLQLGVLSGVTEDSIRFYWDLLTPGTAAAGARLDVERVPGRVECRGCGRVSDVDDDFPMCPACAGVDLVVLAGDGCAIEAVETAELDQGTAREVVIAQR